MMVNSSVLFSPGGQKILVIFAHPDDAESYCGGTVARLVEEKKDVHYLVITRGDKGSHDPNMTPEHLSTIREQEQSNAANILGVQTVTFLDGYYDGFVTPSLELRKDLIFHIRKWQPDVIFTFDPWKKYELHPDHRAAGTCAVDAIAISRDPMTYPEQPHHNVKQAYFFNTDEPNHWVDISAVIDKKIEGRCAHVSQVNSANHPGGYLRRWGAEAGQQKGYAFAETFHYMSL